MSKKSKTIKLSMLLALVMAVLLAGCSKNTNEPAASDQASSSKQAASESASASPSGAEALEPVHLTMVYPGDIALLKDNSLVEDELNKYLKDKINATVTLKPLDWASLNDKYPLLFASGEDMDLVFNPSWLNFYSNVAKDAFLPLDDLLEQYGQGIKETINPTFLKGPVVNGKLYAIPVNKELSQGYSFFYLKDIADKYGLDFSKIQSFSFDTADQDLSPIFNTVKEPGYSNAWIGNDHTFGGGAGDTGIEVLYRTGGFNFLYVDKNDPTFTVKSYAASEQYKKQVELYQKWYKDGFINKDAATTNTGITDAVKGGKAWFWIGTRTPGADATWSNNVGKAVQEQVIQAPYVTTDSIVGSQYGIARTSKNPERAMMLLNLLYTDKYVVNLLNFGIEGKHYKKISDNTIERIKDSGYNGDFTWIIGNEFLDYLQSNENPNKWEDLKEFNDTAEASALLGFVFDAEPVKNELAALNNVRGEFARILESGSVEPEPTLQKFNDKLKAAGIDKVIAEMQKQLDEWAKANGNK